MITSITAKSLNALSEGRAYIEDLERIKSKAIDQDEIFRELEGLSPEELNQRDVRRLEVYARNKLAEEWIIDDPRVREPLNIVTHGSQPSADNNNWRITIPNAESEISLISGLDRLINQPELSSEISENVFHEVGHKISHLAEENIEPYEELQEYMYREAMAMGSVLILKDEEELSDYYREKDSDLESLLEESPAEHIDPALEIGDQLADVLEYAEERLEEIDFDSENILDMRSELRDFCLEMDEKKREVLDAEIEAGKIPKYYKNRDNSVLDSIVEDLFLFTNLLRIGPKSDIQPYKNSEGEIELESWGLPYREPFLQYLEPQEESENIFNQFSEIVWGQDELDFEDYVFSPEDLEEATRSYIREAREKMNDLKHGEVEDYRTHLINREIADSRMLGHTLGYKLGRKIEQSPEYSFAELVKMEQDEAIDELEPLMEDLMDEYSLSLPLDMEVKRSYTGEDRIDYKNFVAGEF